MKKYRVIVAGRRDFRETSYIFSQLDSILAPIRKDIEEIVTGGAAGVDTIAAMYASARGHPLRIFQANWNKHGKAAGPIRNKQMAQYGNFLITFWDGKSKDTQNMIKQATEHHLEKFIIRI